MVIDSQSEQKLHVVFNQVHPVYKDTSLIAWYIPHTLVHPDHPGISWFHGFNSDETQK